MKLVYVFDPREVSGTALPIRLPSCLARAYTWIRPHLDYAPNADGTESEPYAETYPALLKRAERSKRYAYAAISALVLVCLAYVHTYYTEARTHVPTPTVHTCWTEARDADEADLYCGTYAQSEAHEVLTYTDVMPTQAVYVCANADQSTYPYRQCVESFVTQDR